MYFSAIMCPTRLDLPLVFSTTLIAICIIGVLFLAVTYFRKEQPNIPWVTLDEHGLMNSNKARIQWMIHSKNILDKGLTKIKGVFQTQTGDGPKIILSNWYADEIRNIPGLVFAEASAERMMAKHPGFEPFALIKSHDVIQNVIKFKLNRALDSMTAEFADETIKSLRTLLGNNSDWQSTSLKPMIYKLVARLSSRVFLGAEGCNNEQWLDIAVSYTMNSFMAARALKSWSPILRPIVNIFLPECHQIRRERDITRSIITAILRQRMARRKTQGGVSERTADMMAWIDEVAKSKNVSVKMEDAQLLLAVAAIHTTTETLSYLILDLLDHPEIIQRLREEMNVVLSTEGWTKTSLQQMRYLDSVLKESQRLHRLDMRKMCLDFTADLTFVQDHVFLEAQFMRTNARTVTMERKALRPFTLSSGFHIPANSNLCVYANSAFDESIFPSPHSFIPDRFLKLRDDNTNADNANKWQFVSTGASHLGFGHGRHACPGRFFANNEIKIAVIHLLLKYDWKYSEEGKLQEQSSGTATWVPYEQRVAYRRRACEVPGIN